MKHQPRFNWRNIADNHDTTVVNPVERLYHILVASRNFDRNPLPIKWVTKIKTDNNCLLNHTLDNRVLTTLLTHYLNTLSLRWGCLRASLRRLKNNLTGNDSLPSTRQQQLVCKMSDNQISQRKLSQHMFSLLLFCYDAIIKTKN